jgi:2-polyprenyl-3-methyl-5-hydroxy-6-metoxy-1,4-benzoquinol methylase
VTATESTCRLCRSTLTARLFVKQQVDYWRCAECRFRFATPDPDPNLANAIDDYEDAYLQYLAPDRGDDANFRALYRWMARVAALEGKTLLDVGAGSGKLVRFLRGRGIDATGVEPSRALFDRFLAGDDSFTCTTLDGLRRSNARVFDVVTAFDVIEHVGDPVAFLREVAAALKPGGVLFASTPDVESLPARLFGRRWHFYYPYHVSYFGRRTLERAAAAQGLRLVGAEHRGRLRSLGYVIRYAAEFVGGGEAPAWARWFDGWYVPINLFDTVYAGFRRVD